MRFCKKKWVLSGFSAILGYVIPNSIPFMQHRFSIKQYNEQLRPEIEGRYKYYAEPNKYKFEISNVGFTNCTRIWASETVYLIIGEEVYEGDDVPHFNYFVFNNSREKMWDLDKGKTIEIDIADYQLKAFSELLENYNPIIITRWKINYSGKSFNRHYIYENYYVFDTQENTFRDTNEVVGGTSYKNAITVYLTSGSKKSIRIFLLTGQFELDPPPAFLVRHDYTIFPLYLRTKVTINDFNESLLFVPEQPEIQVADDFAEGILRYVWTYGNGKWQKAMNIGGKARMFSKPIRLEPAYLSDEERKIVMANPSLLKYYRANRKKPEFTAKEILERAMNVYLTSKTNN